MIAPPASLRTGRWRVILRLLAVLPQGLLSRLFGTVADIPLPGPLRPAVLGAFARALRIDPGEAALPLKEYPSVGAFFIRRLRAGARKWPPDPNAMGAPVDGIVGTSGKLRGNRLLQAKGRWYSGAELLDDDDASDRFRHGTFITLYLGPRHYHRIHAPTAGIIRHARHVPGSLLPVNPVAVTAVPDLFARNERLIVYIDGPLGRVAVVAVGAFNVGRISATFDPLWGGAPGATSWATNAPRAVSSERHYRPPIRIRRGDELMIFHLGSTVVLLFEAGAAELADGLESGTEIRLGRMIARSA